MDIESMIEVSERGRKLYMLNDENLIELIKNENELQNYLSDSVDVIDEAIARQSVNSEDVAEAITVLKRINHTREQVARMVLIEWAQPQKAIQQTVDLAITALQACQPWVSVKDRLPKSGKEILMNVTYNNRNQSKYDKVTKGFYVERFSIKEETWSDYTGNEDYCEDDDTYYIRQGWYSVCNFVDGFSYIDVPSGFTVTHWKPLPEPPESEG